MKFNILLFLKKLLHEIISVFTFIGIGILLVISVINLILIFVLWKGLSWLGKAFNIKSPTHPYNPFTW